MPPGYVKTIREELLYEYAKLISRSAFQGRLERAFITKKFQALRNGQLTISGSIREWAREAELPMACVFCGAADDLHMDHLVPRSRGGKDEADNMAWSCRTCNTSRGDKGVFEWLGLKRKDDLHRIVAGKYLKELFVLHEAAATLDIGVHNLQELCGRCHLGHVCEEWDKVGKLTCFCLESILA